MQSSRCNPSKNHITLKKTASAQLPTDRSQRMRTVKYAKTTPRLQVELDAMAEPNTLSTTSRDATGRVVTACLYRGRALVHTPLGSSLVSGDEWYSFALGSAHFTGAAT